MILSYLNSRFELVLRRMSAILTMEIVASHLILVVFIVDTRIIVCVAHPLQQGRFACISPADD